MVSKLNKHLAHQICKFKDPLEEWLGLNCKAERQTCPPFYSSVDLRDSGFKTVPVDCNIYPAGFNNICPDDLNAGPDVFKQHLNSLGKYKKILILPELHTTNKFYLDNLAILKDQITKAGYETMIGWYGENSPSTLESQTGEILRYQQIEIKNGTLQVDGFVPDLIILNNDFSNGYPKDLDSVKQPIMPSYKLGWHTRKKSTHFLHYNELAGQFARIIDVDPWLVQIDTEVVDSVDFNENVGVDRVAASVEKMLERIKKAYAAQGVKERNPFVYIKNNSGTYGMGIMMVHSAEELISMNRRTKNKMSVGKGRSKIESVIVQEGVPSSMKSEGTTAEPVIYLVGGQLLGGFLRTNPEKDDEGNLNSPGMVFKKLCVSDLLHEGRDTERVLERVYGWTARISAFAAGRELAASEKK
jgi:glutamate--cysteine ligase